MFAGDASLPRTARFAGTYPRADALASSLTIRAIDSTSNPSEPEFLKVEEVAARLKVKDKTVREALFFHSTRSSELHP